MSLPTRPLRRRPALSCGMVIGTYGGNAVAIIPNYSYTFVSYIKTLEDKMDDECYNAFIDEVNKVSGFPTSHTVGGAGIPIHLSTTAGYLKRVFALTSAGLASDDDFARFAFGS